MSLAPASQRQPASAPTGANARPEGLLAEIAAGLAGDTEMGALLTRFLDPIVRLAQAQAAAVRVLSPAGDRLQWVAALGLPDGLCSQQGSVDRHCGHCGAAADGQTMVWASDLSDCNARSQGDFFGKGCQRLLAVPLQHRGRVLGVYNLFFAGQAQPSPDVLAVLRSVGDLLGLALNNARLEQQTLQAALASERQMMAADVHDSLAQSLTFIKMRLPLLQDALHGRDHGRAQQYVDELGDVVSEAHAALRGIISQLRTPIDPQGLLHALGVSGSSFRQRSGAEFEFVNELPQLQLGPDQAAQVLHIVQEALSNVARHACAQHAWLHIRPLASDGVEITVDDDGAGLEATPLPTGREPCARDGHHGLAIMQDRALRIGAALAVGRRPGGGTRVRLSLGGDAGRAQVSALRAG